MNLRKLWKKLEQPHSCKYINEDDYCLYAREYKSRQGYQYGLTNSLIFNFKKLGSVKEDRHQWWYRNKAVIQFKKEIEQFIEEDLKATVTAIPSSKSKNHPEYSNRFEDLFKTLLKSRPKLIVEWPVEIKKNVESAHYGGKRNPNIIKSNYRWSGFNKTPDNLVVFDDVLTTGAHFRAISDFLRENNYKGNIIGVFWAKAINDISEKS